MSERINTEVKINRQSLQNADLNNSKSFELLQLSRLSLGTFTDYISQSQRLFHPLDNIQLQLCRSTSELSSFSIHIGSCDTNEKSL